MHYIKTSLAALLHSGRVLAALLTLAATAAPAIAADNPADRLAEYVARPDDTYAWREVGSGRIGGTEYAEITLTSQTWRGIPWKHQLILFHPERRDGRSAHQAFLFIHGGRWRPEYENGWQGDMPREARIFARLAESIGAPVGVLRQVPQQPLFEGRVEDALIAYTFDQYLKTGDEDWPLLLPMVKSAVRGMDAMQAFTAARWQSAIEKFTVSGASKRGWTTWLTAAVDPRVASIAPMVIDMLDIPRQIELQRATFGTLSEEVKDYADIDLPSRLDSERGQRLLTLVDPYRYRERFTQPKLILLGTNDPYWPLDALGIYWEGLPQPKNVLYLPNQRHGLNDIPRLIGSLSAVHRLSARGEALPKLNWQFAREDGRLSLTVEADRPPQRVTLWSASSATRDFRESRWRSQACRLASGAFRCERALAGEGYTAMYAEVIFVERGEADYSLSTRVCIAAMEGASDDCS